MNLVTDRSFGLLIAYLIPGWSVLFLWGREIPEIGRWFSVEVEEAATVGGFLFATLAAIAVGMVLSTLRWFLLDPLLWLCGVRMVSSSGEGSPSNIEQYRLSVDFHYRYYQFYGSSLLVMLLVLAFPPSGFDALPVFVRFVVVSLSILFFVASWDTLRKAYARGRFVSLDGSERNVVMTNGGHHGTGKPQGDRNSSAAATAQKPVSKGDHESRGDAATTSKPSSEK